MHKQTRLIISLMVSMAMLCGCTMSTFKAKSGSGDPSATRALLTTEKEIAISRIDDKDVFVTARNWWIPVVTKTKASLIPGPHTLVIKYAQTGWSSLGCRVTLDAQPGKTYLIKGKRLPYEANVGTVAVKKPQIVSIVIWVEEAETGMRVIDETACEPIES